MPRGPRERRRPRRLPPALRQGELQPRRDAGAPSRRRVPVTFPVLFAFSLGVFVMGLLYSIPAVGQLLFLLGVVGTSYGLAHVIVRRMAERRARQASARR